MRKVKLTLLMLLVALAVQAQKNNCYVVKAGDADDLLATIERVNQQNAEPTAPRTYILLPNATYDLGKRVLTTITGHNVTLAGQSMNGTIIVNAPDIADEGISKTATIRIRGHNTYLQDLTLKNALKYYESGFAGRAVCLQDKGTRTICKRVRMLSFQDTYYCDNESAQHYFENAEIHGTVDFICGAGDIYFNRCAIVTELRSADGKGRCVIAAPRTSNTPWGYIFDHCVVYNRVSPFQFARAWKATPHCVWLSTTLKSPDKLDPKRFDEQGMSTCDADFLEYRTMDADGNVISPRSNVLTFTLKDDSHTQETILTDEQARRYELKKIFPDWRPEKIVSKEEPIIAKLFSAYL